MFFFRIFEHVHDITDLPKPCVTPVAGKQESDCLPALSKCQGHWQRQQPIPNRSSTSAPRPPLPLPESVICPGRCPLPRRRISFKTLRPRDAIRMLCEGYPGLARRPRQVLRFRLWPHSFPHVLAPPLCGAFFAVLGFQEIKKTRRSAVFPVASTQHTEKNPRREFHRAGAAPL